MYTQASSNMIDLNNKTILITGASSGIGKATALLCDRLGASLVLTGRKTNVFDEYVPLLSKKPQIIPADLSLETEIASLLTQLPQVDGFVHCAGIIQPLPIKFLKLKNMEDLFRINFNSAVLLSSGMLAAKKLNPSASVVFISSISSNHPYTGGAMYASSKAALEAFARSFAWEASAKKIRVNTLAPGLVRTKIFEQSELFYSKEEVEHMESRYPLGIGEPEDIANTIAFLLSTASKWITGSIIKMDGGLLLNSK
jgi:NAD(P)-dependent dehydrogenase (short-subunit alcohol dehydrogenase family)